MYNIIFFSILFIGTVYASDTTEKNSSVLAKSISCEKISSNFSPRRLTPGERERLSKQTSYIIESAAEPSENAERSSPKTERLEQLHIKFDLRPLLAYNEKTGTFRIIKDESELQQGESPRSYSPRTEKSLREKFNIQD